MTISRIISGAQTGADRAALDAAMEAGEDGVIPETYPNLEETNSSHYEARTRNNVRDADATLILSHGELHGGSRFCHDEAETRQRPFLHVDLDQYSIDDAVTRIRDWLSGITGDTLNVAGPRESSDPKIYKATKEIVKKILDGNTT
jgi:hypothetical protein